MAHAEADVRTAIWHQDIDRIDDVGAVVLEADSKFSVIKQLGSSASAIADVPELGGFHSSNRSDE